MKKLSLIIPCYNQQETLPSFYQEINSVIESLNYDYELIFIDDGSTDKTLPIIRKLSAQDIHIVYLSFSRNFGKESAMYAGFCNADGDYIAVMDADMQYPPFLLPRMLKILESGKYDSVATRRTSYTGDSIIRSWFLQKLYQIINKISNTDVMDGTRDFQLMRREMMEAIVSMNEYQRFSNGIYGWIGFRTYWLPYKNAERIAGKAKWSFWKICKYTIDGIINFSQAPLNIASWFGVLMTFFSFIIMILIIIRKLLLGYPVVGWASIICIIILIGGIQLFCIGIMGQYIAKTYIEIKHRPHFIIAETNQTNIEKIK